MFLKVWNSFHLTLFRIFTLQNCDASNYLCRRCVCRLRDGRPWPRCRRTCPPFMPCLSKVPRNLVICLYFIGHIYGTYVFIHNFTNFLSILIYNHFYDTRTAILKYLSRLVPYMFALTAGLLYNGTKLLLWK